ncbi:Hypothetical Protein FCC1311_051502 [Hondaea fermentalgiana]|uniref:CENP-V/GFA domain-containing protein n=1 Tax=Hondaea fermentalgiana TaxID=2315210 RepID=A0A2R5GF36_9STRA|nr:Hypothetical Protein FCC1311_051502 [Hondaea fermentalgiana]|eukprot:GBG28929.1 Hypothetical Protein FCC1311_051502 [Hondaea fermentalgiana]
MDFVEKRPVAAATVVCAALAGAAWLWRLRRRAKAPRLKSALRCPCGKIRGTLETLAEDNVRLRCYCESCTMFAKWAEEQSKAKGIEASGLDESKVCAKICMTRKANVTFESGVENLKLSYRNPKSLTSRVYAACCGAPVFNTGRYLGFIGVYEVCIENPAAFGEKEVLCFPEEAQTPPTRGPNRSDLSPLDFLLVLLCYAFDAKSGPPIDYDQEPVYFQDQGSKKIQ